MDIKITSVATDVFFSVIRCNVCVSEATQSKSEDYSYFLDFDPNNKPKARAIQDFVEYCKQQSRAQFSGEAKPLQQPADFRAAEAPAAPQQPAQAPAPTQPATPAEAPAAPQQPSNAVIYDRQNKEHAGLIRPCFLTKYGAEWAKISEAKIKASAIVDAINGAEIITINGAVNDALLAKITKYLNGEAVEWAPKAKK